MPTEKHSPGRKKQVLTVNILWFQSIYNLNVKVIDMPKSKYESLHIPAHADLIQVPLNLGCDRQGVEQTPRKVREGCMATLLSPFESYEWKVIDIPDRDTLQPQKYQDHPHIKFFNPILTASHRVYDMVSASLRSHRFPFLIGGDHAMSFGSIAATSAHFGKEHLAVIYIDAHGDFNTEQTSASHNMHGMHLAFLMGQGEERASRFFSGQPMLIPEQIYFFGTRALDPGEQALARHLKLPIATAAQIATQGIEAAISSALHDMELRHIEHIYISFDVDAIDPSVLPGTGVPEPDGLMPDAVVHIFRSMLATGKVCCIDMVELNTLIDPSGRSYRVVYDIFHQLVG